MLSTLLLSLVPCATPAPFVAVAAPAPLCVQDDEREDVAIRLKEFRAHLKRKGEEDQQAVTLIDGFVDEFDDYGPKDRAAVVDALDDALKQKRKKPLENDEPDNRLYIASVVALGEMAPESVKPLRSWLGNKTFKRNLAVRIWIVTSLGKTESPDAIDDLLDLMKDDEAQLQAAAAKALGRFDGQPQDERKKIFRELLGVLGKLKEAKDEDVRDIEAFERWSLVSGSIKDTLSSLSGHDARKVEEWQEWWDENQKKDWDEL